MMLLPETKVSPLVSIVIPIYNVSRYLPQCLESVIHQTYRNIEVILIDDGSTDTSGTICDDYVMLDERVRVLHTENHGLSAARNLGLKQVKGEYISFVDGDDWIEPNTIEILLNTALRTEAVIVTAYRWMEYVNNSIPSNVKETDIHVYQGNEILSIYAEGKLCDVVWNKLYHKVCFSDIRFPEGHNYEDIIVTPRLMKMIADQGGIVAVFPEKLFHFRMRKSSISHTISLNNIIDSWISCRGKFDSFPEYQMKLLSSCYIIIGRMWSSYHKFPKKDKNNAAETIREMQAFSKAHYHLVMNGSYSKPIKIACTVSQSRSTLIMLLCYYCGRIRHMMKNRGHIMFE